MKPDKTQIKQYPSNKKNINSNSQNKLIVANLNVNKEQGYNLYEDIEEQAFKSINQNQKSISPMIANKQPPQKRQQLLEAPKNKKTRIQSSKRQIQIVKGQQDIQFPTIQFIKPEMFNKLRKASQNSIRIGLQQSRIDQLPKIKKGQQQQSEITIQDQQWKNWNVDKLKIIPSNNNYLDPNNVLQVYQKQKAQKGSSKRQNKSKKSNRTQLNKQQKERQRRQRQRGNEMINQFLSGKASVVWLFILGQDIKDDELIEIKKIYMNHAQRFYEIPICRTYTQALKYLTRTDCYFKVVVDIQNSYHLIADSSSYNNVRSIYIYNKGREKGINRIFQMKKNNRKIKGMFMNLDQVAKIAEGEIDDQVTFVKVGDQLQMNNTKLRFPSFFVLNGVDGTEVTAYRLCLYGAIKLQQKKQRQTYLKEFTSIVELRYKDVQVELKNLADYMKINHSSINNESKFRQILNFYVKQTFYYSLTNSILRMSKTPDQFRPCTIPFNQTYHAIKHYYKKYRTEVNNKISKFITYRGTKFRNSDVKLLQIGNYIQLLGFTSTSLKRSQAQKFMGASDSYLLEIEVQNTALDQHQLAYDHGFIEINRYKIAQNAFQNEQQVLFNALNTFKILSVDLESADRVIRLKYGAIFDLLRQKAQTLTPQQRSILSNYSYCIQRFNKIEDDGDVLLLAQQHDKCIEYYENKIIDGQSTYKFHGKLANVQLESGNLDQAYRNAMLSLQLLNQEQSSTITMKDLNHMEQNKEIFEVKEDLVHFKATIEKYVKFLGSDWFKQARILRESGQFKMKNGDMQGCKLDLMKAKEILLQKERSFERRRKEIEKRYFFRSFCCMCSRKSKNQMNEQKDLQILDIQSQKVDYDNKKNQIQILFFQIQNLLKEFAEKAGDHQLKKECQSAAKIHFDNIDKNQTINPLKIAKFCMMEAILIDHSQNASQFQSLVQQAIQNVKKVNPMHIDLSYCQRTLANTRMSSIKKKLHMPSLSKSQAQNVIQVNSSAARPRKLSIDQLRHFEFQNEIPLSNEDNGQKYDYEEYSNIYDKSKENYLSAANNILYNKGKEHFQYLEVRNQMTELDLSFSQLSSSQSIAIQTTSISSSQSHTEGARCYLLLARIALAKGELKRGFRQIQQALSILKVSLVKQDNKKYNSILMNHPYYLQINLHKVKIFSRQLKHDLALKQLGIIKKIAKIKVQKSHSRILMATVYEQQADVLICAGQTEDFEQYLTRAIDIRRQQIGQFNIPNAVCFSNLFKYLRHMNDYDEALSYHFKASEIFSRFPSDHPNAWVIHLSNSLVFHQKNDITNSLQQLQYCLKIIGKRYSKNHINFLKIHFQYGKLLLEQQQYERSLRVFQQLETVVDKSVKQSFKAINLQNYTDDEKLTLRKHIIIKILDVYNILFRKADEMNTGNSYTYMKEIKRFEMKARQYEFITGNQLQKC